jgi:hypothetical protein
MLRESYSLSRGNVSSISDKVENLQLKFKRNHCMSQDQVYIECLVKAIFRLIGDFLIFRSDHNLHTLHEYQYTRRLDINFCIR